MDGRTVPNSDRDGWWQSIIINVGSTSVAAFRRRFFFFWCFPANGPTNNNNWPVDRPTLAMSHAMPSHPVGTGTPDPTVP